MLKRLAITLTLLILALVLTVGGLSAYVYLHPGDGAAVIDRTADIAQSVRFPARNDDERTTTMDIFWMVLKLLIAVPIFVLLLKKIHNDFGNKDGGDQ